jgi:glycosyltransferase involved in cell wall biosynthesis
MEPGSERKTHVIYNYVDTNKFTPTEKTWEGINVLFPRRLTVLRGSTEVTKAFINLPQYNFTLAGQAHDDKAAQAFFKSHEHRKNVKFIQKEMDEMPEVYKQADISLVPTISTEGLSLSLLESMASGLPVITTPVGGLGDAIIDNYNALIYDPNHDNICDYIEALAEDEETRLKMGKRNREIAVECFDIEIWKQKWRNLLAQFGAMPEKVFTSSISGNQSRDSESLKTFKKEYICEWSVEIPKKPKLVAMMLTHNEAGRYLERVIENTLLFCDEIAMLDDHSDRYEDLVELCEKLESKYPNRIHQMPSYNSWEDESLLRKELLYNALQYNPDWLIAIDADELYEADRMNEQLPYLVSQTDADWVGFRFFDMWDDEQHYRDDDNWPAGTSYAPRMFRVKGKYFRWPEKRRHCGSVPANVIHGTHGINSSVRVKHLGWMKPDDRNRKYLERLQDDPNNEFYSEETYDAILSPYPTLVKWDDNNPWQTSKLTIAYPPGMDWNIMQQRPHHLLKLAAGERNRVIFGDDSTSGVYEALPFFTIVGGDEFNSFMDKIEVDILYVTSPDQMQRCQNIKYKNLVYDCCDWMNGADIGLIKHADHVLCASILLYDKVKQVLDGFCLEVFGSKRVIYLPNACDFDHFSKAGEAGTMLGEKLPEPIVGYMGCIHPVMIDAKIVETLADKFKLLFIGQNKGMEFNHPNIYEAGHVAYQDLPRFLSAAQVGIIPFRTDSDYLRYSAPIKVYEYLSAGRPVVASPIPELQPLADMGLIRIVANDDLDGWVKAVEEAINEYPNIKGIEYAKTQTWENRWQTFKKEVLK